MPRTQDRVRATQNLFIWLVVIHYHVHSVQILRIDTMASEHFRREVALQRSKLQLPTFVALQQKLNPAITQTANAVIENNWMFVNWFRHALHQNTTSFFQSV